MLAVANHAWSILWRRLRRKHGAKAVGYAKIVELTKNGTPHLHIIARVPFIAQTSLAAQWKQLTGSYVVDIRKVETRRGIAGYLTSYLTKALEVPPGMRKWSAARGFVPPEPKPELEEGELPPFARFATVEPAAIVEQLLALGYRFEGAWLIQPQPPPNNNHAPRPAA